MTVQRLINCFSKHQNVVEVTDVRDQIVEWGFYDKIVISPFDKDANYLLGTMVHFSVPVPPPYASEQDIYVVRYNRNVSINWQRLICVKELVHSMDPVELRTGSKVQLDQMLRQMLVQHSDDVDPNVPALFEDVAVFQALAILCPEEIREVLYKDYHSGSGGVSLQSVADRFRIPVELAGYLMVPSWHAFRNRLSGISW